MTSAASDASTSGINFDWIWIREIAYSDSNSGELLPPGTEVPTELEVKAILRDDRGGVRVSLGVRCTLASTGSEANVEIYLRMEGQFTLVGEPSVDLEQFAKLQAPVIMLPFIRETLASISQKTRIGQVLMNPMNLSTAIATAAATAAPDRAPASR